jgi:phenylalanine-4-hydroxylase
MNTEIEHYIFKGKIDSDKYQSVWDMMLEYTNRLKDEYKDYIHEDYFMGLEKLSLCTKIPLAEEINNKLIDTHWKIMFVTGFIPSYIYVWLQKNKIFPISIKFRKAHQLNFSPIPDFLHDIFGHLPLLFSKEYRDLIQTWADAASECAFNSNDAEHYKAADYLMNIIAADNYSEQESKNAHQLLELTRMKIKNNPSNFSYFERFYLWSFEFGVLKLNSKANAIGAAIITSPNELINFSHSTQLYNITDLDYDEDVDYGDVQLKYYSATSYNNFKKALLLAKQNTFNSNTVTG